MKKKYLVKILQSVKTGELSIEDATRFFKEEPFLDLGFAKIDAHRELRRGVAEVVYGAGKTPEQIKKICEAANASPTLVTRISSETAGFIGAEYFTAARIGIIGKIPPPDGAGKIAVVTGGTSDIPVAEEAAVTAEALGNEVERLYDAGVAGLHRLLANLRVITDARVVIAVAGMEGALASVVGGLAEAPVIAVPTSVGYGASFGGLSALLSMLNCCAAGVSVVNIDNGFGAGYLASKINHIGVN